MPPPHLRNCDKDRKEPECSSPPPPVSHKSNNLFIALVIAASVLAFLTIVAVCVTFAIRRRRRQRRRQALLDAVLPATPAPADDHEDGGGVVHHAWHIRTVGLDEAAIASIAVTEYRAGKGLLGAADCSVCLGEFRDGELVRLLPKCGHAFHVPCIDAWLRAHVNCPLCRYDVLDTAAEESDPPADANANTMDEQVTINGILEHEDPGQEDEQDVQSIEINRPDQLSSPEPLPQRRQNMRRVASMDSGMVSTVVDIAALSQLPEETSEDEQNSKEKQGNGVAVCCKVAGSGIERSLSVGGRRSFFSRQCGARSSVLP